jgi:hypothetical protein
VEFKKKFASNPKLKEEGLLDSEIGNVIPNRPMNATDGFDSPDAVADSSVKRLC